MINTRGSHKGFSMLEAMVTVLIGAMVLVALFMIFGNARRIAASINSRIEADAVPNEIFQRIMEDLDRVAGPGSGAKIEVHNNYANGFPGAQLKITSTMLDKDNKPQVLEEIIWQTSYDLASKRLMLWRCHSGLVWEDKLLDRQERADWTANRHIFVPVCTGLSYFRIQIPQPQQSQPSTAIPVQTPSQTASARNRARQIEIMRQRQQQDALQQNQSDIQYLYSWEQPQLPPAIMVVLSTAEPIESRGAGGVEVLDDYKLSKTISMDRLKKFSFNYVPLDTNTVQDPNKTEANEPGQEEKSSDLNKEAEKQQALPSDRKENSEQSRRQR